MVPQQPSAAEELVRALVGFPKYAAGWVLGLITAILTDLNITTIAVTGVAVGLATSSVLTGLAVFFVVYSLLRGVNLLSSSIGFGFQRLSDATYAAATARPDTKE